MILPLAGLLFILSGCPTAPDLTPRPNAGERLIRLVHLSDPQLVDEESPARSLRTESLIAPSWRPQEAWGVHTLDATLRRVNALHTAGPPVDFAVITGDMCDLAQVNELQWFIDTMDGREVTPDSGAPKIASPTVSGRVSTELVTTSGHRKLFQW